MINNNKFNPIKRLFLMFLLSLFINDCFAQIIVDQSEFPADGKHQTQLIVTNPGMYHIAVQSGQGSGLELIDRMNGIIAESGGAGKSDGFFDILLDIGSYRLSIYSVKNGLGTAKVSTQSFQSRQKVANISKFPQLQYHQLIQSELKSREKISFWVNFTNRKQFNLEAMGRSLSTCLLWKNGVWLSEINATKSKYEVKNGQPMTYVEFHQTLNPGLYLLSCYGSTVNKWASETSQHPFYLRMGIPELPENGMEKISISPFGRDVYLAPKNTNFFQVSRDQKKDTNLQVHRYRNNQSRFNSAFRKTHAKITKKSKFPWCQVKTKDRAKQLVVVQSQPGDIIRLRYLNNRIKSIFNKKSGPYWISTVESVEGLDSLEFTPFLMDKRKLVNAQIPEVGLQDIIKRKTNLFGKTHIWFFVQNNGKYQIIENQYSAAKGRFTISNNRYKKVRPVSSKQKNQYVLKKGYYSLSISPEKKGILEFALIPQSMTSQTETLFKQSGIVPKNKSPQAFILTNQNIKYSTRTELIVNQRFSVEVGLINRKLPLNLRENLPLYLNANQEVLIQFDANGEERLEVIPNREGPFILKLNEALIQSGAKIPKGRHELLVKNSGSQKDIFLVKTIPTNLDRLNQEQISDQISLGDQFFELPFDQVLYQHFNQKERRSFRLNITEPRIYRLETMGLLEMGLKIRTGVFAKMFTAKANGVGRNAIVQQFLKSGVYYVTVQPYGKSTGQAGILVTKANAKKLATLKHEAINRQTVEANTAIIYPIEIKKTGIYQIQTLGMQKAFQSRFDDSRGWPLVKPGKQGSIKLQLDPGIYYYYSLPSALESKRVTTIFKYMDHADHLKERESKQIHLNRKIKAVWRETENRQEDRYELEVPAALDIQFSLSKNFEMNLLQENSDFQYSFKSYGGVPPIKKLQPGRYFLYVNSIEINDKVPYELSLRAPGQLAPGLNHYLSSFPTELKVSLAEQSIVDIFSFGLADTSARLSIKDDEGDWQLIAKNDDRESDWNFLISSTLNPGIYQLRVDLESSQNNATYIQMETRSIVEEEQVSIPFSFEEVIGNEVIEIPILVPEDGIVKFENNSSSTVQLQVFYNEKIIAESLNHLYLPLRENQQYTLRLKRLNTLRDSIQITGILLNTQSQDLLLGQESRFKIINSDETALRITALGEFSYYFKGRPAFYYCAYEFDQQCEYRSLQPFYFNDGNGWMIPADSDLSTDIAVTPFQIDQIEKLDFKLSEIPMLFNITGTQEHLTLLKVESVNQQIGINLNHLQNESTRQFNWLEMGFSKNQTFIATDIEENITVKIWSSERNTSLTDVSLQLQTIPIVDQYEITSFNDNSQNHLLPESAHLIEVNPDPGWLNVILQKGLTLVKIKEGIPTQVATAEHSNQMFSIKLENEKLYIYNTTLQNRIYRLVQQYYQFSDAPDVSISALNPSFASFFENKGIVQLNIEEQILGDRVYVDGDVKSCKLFGRDGTIGKCILGIKGNRFSPGVLRLQHERGLVSVWMGGSFNDYKAHLGKVAATPKLLLLNHGVGTLNNETELWELNLAEPQLLVIDHSVGGLTYIQKDKTIVAGKTSKNVAGRQIVHYLEAGDYQIITKPLTGLTQNGKMTISLYPPESLFETEHLQLNKLLTPNEFHLFTFELDQSSHIGCGVNTEFDNIQAQLFNGQFQKISEGPLMVNHLETGRYILIVHSENTDETMLYQPLLYGTKGMEQRMPPAVLEGYVK